MFNIHAMMLDDDDFVDAIKDIIQNQMVAPRCGQDRRRQPGRLFRRHPDLQARSADVIYIAQAMLDILQGVDNASLQGTSPASW